MKKIYFLIFLIFIAFAGTGFSQENKKTVAEMTKEELTELSYQDLMNLSLEDLMVVANKFGLSADEILEYFLNKDVTSASKRAEKSLNSPLSTTVISRNEIQNSGATSIPEALRLVPGMIVREKTKGNYDIHIRGNDNMPPKGMFVYSENSISLIMIDGRPVYNYSFGGTFWEALPIDLVDVERIEVIRGPSSALYGPNAASGAINIITRQVEGKKLKADGTVQLGNTAAKQANAGISLGLGNKLKVRLSGNYSYFERFQKDFYVFDYNKRFPTEEIKAMRLPTGVYVEEHFDDVFPRPELGLEKYAGNAFLHFDASKNVTMDLTAGSQYSQVISSTQGNHALSVVGRESSTSYVDFRLNAYGFHLQTNYLGGDQDVQRKTQGFHIQPKVFNGSLEYEKTFGSLILRPGISYQSSTYNDEKWVDVEAKGGYLNGAKTLTSLAYYLRADYKTFDKLRLIAALRGDTYNKPDVTKLTYQFIASYDVNENNVVRAGYSRANRGSFMADTYANYYWQIVPGYYTMHYEGNQNMDLPVMDMIEVGYRAKLSKKILFEIEAFHSEMKDFTFFTPDSMILTFDFSPLKLGQPHNTVPNQIWSHGQYQNLDLKTVQNGITVNLSVVVNNNFNFKVFGTVQQTKLSNFYDRTIWQDFKYLQTACATQYGADLMKIAGGDFSPFPQNSNTKNYSAGYKTYRDSSNVSITHKGTPSFYGGLMADYNFKRKLNFNTSFYFYGEQTMLHNKIDELGQYSPEYISNPSTYDASEAYTVQPKILVNLKVSYKFWKDNSVFINARNLLNNTEKEFGFMDQVKGLYLAGISFSF
jgi:iron complex outermembrane receptor protein